MIDIKKVISILLVMCTLFLLMPYSAVGLSWDGDSAGGSTNAVNGSSTGYVIRSTNDSNCVVGYRFSAVNSSGNMKVTKVIDVYRNTGNGDNAYANSAKFSTKYNKKQVIANKNKSLTTTYNTTNCYKESSMGFTTTLPNPSGVETWQSYEANINKVLSKLGVGSVSNMNYGDKVIIEPLFDVCLVGEYKNNTDVKVYVEGFKNDKTQISGVYAIPANSSIVVDGYTFTVPNKKNISIWGGVYLEGMGIYNTDYESDGSNNTLTLNCKLRHPLTLTPIAQNADYRENTEVITSFWLNNSHTDNYIPSQNISVKFNVYNGPTLIKTYTKSQAIVPGKASNLLYFKWKVPTGLNSADVKITGEIIDGGVSYNKVSANYSTTPKITSSTPDTRFEKKAPSGFTINSTPVTVDQTAVWWEWIYESNQFVKKEYGIGYQNITPSITPETGSTANKVGSTWYMKSGYGISLSANNSTTGISGYITPTTSSYTNPQFAVARFPEFEYSNVLGKFRTLALSSAKWIFPANGSYGNIHFTPLWYPDGNYTVSVTLSDMWTPAGMITRTMNTNTIKINDSAYDDWYVGR